MKRLITLLLALALVLVLAISFGANSFAQKETELSVASDEWTEEWEWLIAYENLEVLIAQARTIEQGNYTDASWNTLQTAITDARRATGEFIDAAQLREETAKLQAAIDGLFDPTELKALLSALVEEASAIKPNAYTTDSWNAMQKDIVAAQKLLRDANASKAQLDGQLVALQNAIDRVVEGNALNALATQAYAIEKGDYTDASWNALQKALSDAREARFYAATQAQVEELVTALQAAIDGLVETTALKALIAQAEAIKKGNYTDASWNALNAAIDAARVALNDANATKAQVDEQLALLQAAIDGLAEKMPLALNQSTLNLNYRGTAQLSVTGAEGKVTWSSSSDKVSVSQNGQVTSNYIFGGKKAQAVITAKDSITGQSVSCTVNVAPTALQWFLIVVLFGWIWL